MIHKLTFFGRWEPIKYSLFLNRPILEESERKKERERKRERVCLYDDVWERPNLKLARSYIYQLSAPTLSQLKNTLYLYHTHTHTNTIHSHTLS